MKGREASKRTTVGHEILCLISRQTEQRVTVAGHSSELNGRFAGEELPLPDDAGTGVRSQVRKA
jgi:hypothetical protein